MSKPDSIAFKYVGKNGEFMHGIPQRDLTVADFERLSPLLKAQVLGSAGGSLYKAADAPKAEKSADTGKDEKPGA